MVLKLCVHVYRYDRRQNRKQNHGQGTFSDGLNEAELAETDWDGHAETMDLESDTQTATMDSDTQTDITMDYMQAMEADIQKLRTEKIMLQQKVDRQSVTFSEKFFEREDGSSDDDKVRYYTGLPSLLTLVGVVSFLSPSISSGPRTITSKLQEILIVLFRLRLNLPTQVVADMFKISPTAVSRIFLKVLHVMYIKMKPLISWPDREDLRRNMPFEFRKYFGNKVTVIIDCFELFIETPSLLKARAQTWSNYKHHNTVKYLIGITPQGVVSFISAGWGGRASDKWLTENSTFLDRLLPGDLVLADRGFNIQESVGLMCAEVKIPAFTKGKKQLSAFEVESTRKIAHVRIHVERVIGNIVQKYPILVSTMPITMLNIGENEDATTLDKIVTVCCALVNMCPSVVPFD